MNPVHLQKRVYGPVQHIGHRQQPQCRVAPHHLKHRLKADDTRQHQRAGAIAGHHLCCCLAVLGGYADKAVRSGVTGNQRLYMRPV